MPPVIKHSGINGLKRLHSFSEEFLNSGSMLVEPKHVDVRFMIYKFGTWQVHKPRRMITRGGTAVHVEPQVFDLLCLLIESQGRAVTKDEIFREIWGNRAISDAVLTTRIRSLRRAIDAAGESSKIRTVHGVGYEFLPKVAMLAQDSSGLAPVEADDDAQDESDAISGQEQVAKPPSSSGGEGPSSLRSVMVTPLENQTGQPGLDHIATGIAEELSITLGRLKWLRVVPFGSVLSMCAEGLSRFAIAREFSARYLLDGNVRAFGDQFRISCRLTDCETDRHLWGDQFVCRSEMSFELQDTLVGHITSELGRELTHAEAAKVNRASPASFEVWDYYLRALAKLHLVEQSANALAVKDLEASIALDPEFAPAHSQLAWCYSMAAVHRWYRPGREALAKARFHADKAVAIDPYDPLAFCARSIAHFWRGNLVRAHIAAQQAAELDRGSQIAQGLIGCVQAMSGNPKAALQTLSVALKGSHKDPFRWFWLQGCANACFALERYDEASDLARQVIEMRQGYIHGYVIHVASSNLAGHQEEARQSVEALLKLMPEYSVEMLRSHPIWSDRATITRLGESLLKAGLPENSC